MERTKELLSNREMIDSLTQVVDALGSGIQNLLGTQRTSPSTVSQTPSPPKSPPKHNFARMISRAKDETKQFIANSLKDNLQKLERRFQYFDEKISIDINNYEDELKLTERLSQRRRSNFSQNLKRRLGSNADVGASLLLLESESIDGSSPKKLLALAALIQPSLPLIQNFPKTRTNSEAHDNITPQKLTSLEIKSESDISKPTHESQTAYNTIEGNINNKDDVQFQHVQDNTSIIENTISADSMNKTEAIVVHSEIVQKHEINNVDIDTELEADLAKNANIEV